MPSTNKKIFIEYLETFFQGCQFREHTVQPENERDRAILHLCTVAAEGGNLYEQSPIKAYSNSQGENWWAGIALIPRGIRQGLLPTFHIEGTWFQKCRLLQINF